MFVSIILTTRFRQNGKEANNYNFKSSLHTRYNSNHDNDNSSNNNDICNNNNT